MNQDCHSSRAEGLITQIKIKYDHKGNMTYWASVVAQMVKHLPAMQETWVWSLGWEDPLEKGKTTHSSILTLGNPWTV